MIIDTHSHIYLPEFKNDLEETINRAKEVGISKIILPNIDSRSIENLNKVYNFDPNFFSVTMGLHPSSVKENYKLELENIFKNSINYIGIGEIGIDLYWDKTYFKEQQIAFDYQLNFACENNLPVIIHSRNSIAEVLDILHTYITKSIKGVFHCFPGNYEDAKKIIDYGFYIGIGGIISYKNNNMLEVVCKAPIDYILTETDSPYLSPVPHRGKRNEPAYIVEIIKIIAELKKIHYQNACEQTFLNAKNLFKI